MLSHELREAIINLQKLYPVKRSALIPALHIAQTQEGYLPSEIQEEVAELFGIDASEVNAVVTFYDMFYEKPMGKHLIHVCKNVSCMLRGSDNLLTKLCDKLQVKPGETTADGEYSVIPSECLGACDRAPMMILDEKVIGPVQEADLDQIIVRGKKGPGHPCPVPIEGLAHE
jgi:NADH-quinone oxidoreductase subunit E